MSATSAMLDAVLDYGRRGWPVLPLHTVKRQRCTCGAPSCNSCGKHPRIKAWLQRATTDATIIRQWWRRWPDANVGIVTGARSGIVAIDVDPRNGGENSLDELERQYGELPDTVEAITGGGGRHLLFQHPGGNGRLNNSTGKLGPGLDVKADGGFIVVEPSLHGSGRPYAWELSHHPDEMQPAPLPSWLLRRLTVRDTSAPTPDDGEHRIPEGQRNDTLTRMAGAMRRQKIPKSAARKALHEVNRTDCDPPLELAEVDGIVDSVWRNYPAGKPAELIEKPEPIPLADHFIKQRYRDKAGRLLLSRWRSDFYHWTGSYYQPIPDEAIDAELYRHLDQCRTIQRDQAGKPVTDQNGKPKIRKLVPRAAMVREVRLALPSRGILIDDVREPPFWLDDRRTEPDPTKLIVFEDGLVDLASGAPHPITPELFCTHALPFPYQPDTAPPAAWLAFLADLWPDDPEAIATLQEWFGYVLSPDTRQHKALMLVGPKRGGKGIIGRILRGLLGDSNVAGPPLGSLAQNFGLQPLLGKPLAIISDARLSGRTDQSVVVERLLWITGEDAVTVDRKYKPPVTVKLPTRFMLLTNELPRLTDSSGALAGRFIVLTLTRSWYGREDHALTDRLLGELPGILNWALDGWERLQIRGHFVQPESSHDAIQDLEDLGSPVGAFIRERCIIEAGKNVVCDTLFQAWQGWCANQGRKPGTSQSFSKDLKAAIRAIRTTRPRQPDGSRPRAFEGIGLA